MWPLQQQLSRDVRYIPKFWGGGKERERRKGRDAEQRHVQQVLEGEVEGRGGGGRGQDNTYNIGHAKPAVRVFFGWQRLEVGLDLGASFCRRRRRWATQRARVLPSATDHATVFAP